MSGAFSSGDTALLDRTISVSHGDVKDIVSYFELESVCDWISSNSFKQVAVQIPDEFLRHSSGIIGYLDSHTEAESFVLGDTSYGSCCVDEVGAEHHSADCVVHVGHSCLSRTRRLPVYYAYGRAACSVEQLVAALQTRWEADQKLALVLHTEFYHIRAECLEALSDHFPNATIALISRLHENLQAESKPNSSKYCYDCVGLTFELACGAEITDYEILYVGKQSSFLTNLLLNLHQNAFSTFDPNETDVQTIDRRANKQLQRRYFMVQKAKDAAIIGILVGTLAVAECITVIDRLKRLVRAAGRKCYTVVVGKPNPAKLANLQEIEVYVLVSCAENALLDSSDYYRPVVTPYELELALNPAHGGWSQRYTTDFNEILPGGRHHLEIAESENEEPHVSLISGEMKGVAANVHTASENSDGASSQLQLRSSLLALAPAFSAAGHLSQRTWQGLEQKLGETEPAPISRGLSGIPMQYEDEPTK